MYIKIFKQPHLLLSMALFSVFFLLSHTVAPIAQAQEGEANEETTEIEEILVTARYRSVSVQDIGGSIVAFGAEDMERLGIVDLASLVRATPSLNMQERGPNRNELNIRGVVNFLTTQDLLPSSRPVGVYLDDSPVNTPGGSQYDVRYFDLERVEVLRGPQGTLFGEGSSAGTVRYFSRSPNLSEFGGHLELDSISIDDGGDEVGVRAAVNIPIREDKLGLRISGGRFVNPGFIDLVGGEEDHNKYEADMLRMVLLAKPSDNFSARLMYSTDDSVVEGLGLATGDPLDKESNLQTGPDVINDDTTMANLRLDWTRNNGVFTSITSHFERDRKRDTADQIYSLVNSLVSLPYFGYVDQTRLTDHINYEQQSQEFRFVSNWDRPYQITVGAFYRDFVFDYVGGDTCTDTMLIMGYPDRCTDATMEALGYPQPSPASRNDGETKAFFVELEYDFTDKFKGIFGVRRHSEDLDVYFPAVTTLLYFGLFSYPEISETVSIDKTLPRVAFEYRASDDVLYYASYSTGARNGSLNSPATLGTMEVYVPGSSKGYEAYGPDETAAYEFGVKTRLADGRMTLNTTAFFTDYKDLQLVIGVPPLGFGLLLNAGGAETKGLEIDLSGQMNDNFSYFVGAAFTNAELTEDIVTNQVSGAVKPKGSKLGFTPETSWKAGGEYQWFVDNDAAFYLNSYLSYSGETCNATHHSDDSPEMCNSSFTMVNVGAGYRQANWSVDLFISNLTDRNQYVMRNLFDGFAVANGLSLPAGFTFNEQFVLQPRTTRLTLRYRF